MAVGAASEVVPERARRGQMSQATRSSRSRQIGTWGQLREESSGLGLLDLGPLHVPLLDRVSDLGLEGEAPMHWRVHGVRLKDDLCVRLDHEPCSADANLARAAGR